MIRVIANTRGHLRESSLEEFNPLRKVVWIDVINPTKDEIKKISEKTKIRLEDLKRGLDQDERPTALEFDHGTMVIYKVPSFGKDGVTTVSLSFFITDNYILTLRKNESKSFEKLKQLGSTALHNMMQSTDLFLERIFDLISNTYFNVLDQVEEEVDNIEDEVFRDPKKETVKRIFDVKKTLIYFHKSLTANREVITLIEKGYVRAVKKANMRHFRGVYSDVAQALDMVSLHRDILTGTLDIYLSAVSNSLNKVMKRLTVYATFILVPTFISGVYGMNFRWMPETTWKYGYFFALGLMVVSVTVIYLIFKRRKWI